ncbi:MAG: DegV family protein, partial [Clostridia bacterium]|nr:DegV family protein [Clostridia bacterium]
ARTETADLLIEAAEDTEGQTLYISHADNIEGAELMRDVFLSKAKFKDVYISTIGPIVGASVGPGTIISFVYGKEVTIEGKE